MRRLPEAFLQTARGTRLFVKGQVIVEFALLMPLLLFMSLGFIEAQFLFAAQHSMQIKTNVLAQVAAEKIAILPGESWNANWNTLITSETVGSRCASKPTVNVQFPDVTKKSGDRVKIIWSCPYAPMIQGIWPGLVVTVQSEAVIDLTPIPTPEPSSSLE